MLYSCPKCNYNYLSRIASVNKYYAYTCSYCKYRIYLFNDQIYADSFFVDKFYIERDFGSSIIWENSSKDNHIVLDIILPFNILKEKIEKLLTLS